MLSVACKLLIIYNIWGVLWAFTMDYLSYFGRKRKMDVFEKFLKDHNISKDFGFYWSDPLEIIHHISLELDEVKAELVSKDRRALQDELGDVLHACFTLIAFCEFDAHETLEFAVKKISRRFEMLKKIVVEDGVCGFANLPRETKLLYWERAKRRLLDAD